MVATDQLKFFFGGGAQKICLINFFSNFTITFLALWGCASDFLKSLPKFKMAAKGQLQIFFVGVKTPKLKELEIIKNFPTIWRCASYFFKVLLKFKMAAMDKLHIFLRVQKLKN